MDPSATFTGWASSGGTHLTQWSYHPRSLGERDIDVEISHCGICGSDIHTLKQELGPIANPPCIVGHEIIGKVVARGKNAPHNLGDRVGVGPMIDSCLECDACNSDMNQQCKKMAFTYNDVYKTKDKNSAVTYGGYADCVRVPGDYAFKIPEAISSAEGHLAIQWAAAFNAKEVFAISTSDSKRDEAKKLGATKFVNSRKKDETETLASKIDILLITSFGPDTDYNQLLSWVNDNGHAVMLAVPEEPMKVNAISLVFRNISLTGSLIGGRHLTQEMLESAARHNVRPMIETMAMSDANAAVKYMLEGKPRYRIVMETGK
ncbi:hypothetical protein BGZ73_003848 [Actinomortierella ambigua]|nr:hypothetical protein BGZ73_003848 [Actinomortierella ambigua]